MKLCETLRYFAACLTVSKWSVGGGTLSLGESNPKVLFCNFDARSLQFAQKFEQDVVPRLWIAHVRSMTATGDHDLAPLLC